MTADAETSPVPNTQSPLLDDAFARLTSAARQSGSSHDNHGRQPPTSAQALANNYLKPRERLHGLPIAIENDRNSIREGKRYKTRMGAIYGEITGTMGADGDPLDVFIGHFPETHAVWIINQRHADGTFDEHKVMLGFQSEQAARDAYEISFERGWTGLESIYPLNVDQLKWWIKRGNTKVRFSPDQLPFDGATTMNKTLWNADALPAAATLHKVLYDIRTDDREGLMLDAVSLADVYADPDVTVAPTALLDALVVPVNKLSMKMGVLERTMNAVGGALTVSETKIGDPVKLRGVMQVPVLFSLSDGQTIMVWFHNPDTTPAKLTPMDELISWNWMLNKKDITIVVAPERGKDLNIREVSRRIMRLAERNMEAFKKANAKLAANVEAEFALDAEIAGLEKQHASLLTAIEIARERNADAARDGAERLADPTTPEGYAAIKDEESKLLYWQDKLDAFFQGRIVAVRNALRVLGWDGPTYGDLSKNGYSLILSPKQTGAGRNIVGVRYGVFGEGAGNENYVEDDLTLSDAAVAEVIDAYAPAPVIEPAPIVAPDPAPVVEPEPVVEPVAVPVAPSAEQIAEAEALGRAAGGEVTAPAQDAALMAMIPEGAPVGWSAPLLDAWLRGQVAASAEAAAVQPEPQPEPVAEENPKDHAAWTALVVAAVAEQAGTDTGDAEAIVAAQEFKMAQQWGMGSAPSVAAAAVLAAAAPEPEPELAHAVAALEIAREAASNNEPINREEGNVEQANLEAQVVESIDKAIDVLTPEPQPEPEPPVQPDPTIDPAAVAIAEETIDPASASVAPGAIDPPIDTPNTGEAETSAPTADESGNVPPLPAEPPVDPAPVEGSTSVSPEAVDLGAEPHQTDPAPLDPLPEPLTPENTPAAIDSSADRAYLESLIDGSGDLLAEDTFARLEPMFEKYAADPEMSALLERAATIYGDAAVAAAQSALATPA